MSLKELAPTYYTRLREVTKEVGNARKVLNTGCGDGLYDRFIKNHANMILSFDLNKGDVEIARATNPEKRVGYCLGAIENIPCKAETFDCIICVEVLEHLDTDEMAIKELTRVLKTGGKLIVTVPSKNFPLFYDPLNGVLNRLGMRMGIGVWSWGHKRLYTAKGIKARFDMKVEKTRYLSHSLVGLIENSYCSSFMQRLTKNDPGNRGKVGKNINRVRRAVHYRPHRFLEKLRDMIIWLDSRIFVNSRISIGIMMTFRK